jgi:prepilin-type N-terminal cleavage/methylation domain-containing protein
MNMHKRGFTLAETIMVVVLVGIFIAIAVPRMKLSTISKLKANVVTKKLITDLRRTRTMAIVDAATNSTGYGLRMIAPSPYTGYQIWNLKPPIAVVETFTIDPAVSCTSGNKFDFNTLGNLKTGSSSQIIVSAEGKTYTISVLEDTGRVKWVEN